MLGSVLASGLALTFVLAGCGNVSDDASDAPLHELGPRPASFTAAEVSWAQGNQIHYGERTLQLPAPVQELWRTSYGFIVGLQGPEPDTFDRYVFADARGITDLPGKPNSITVSPDGHYVGWIDYDGPKTSMGRLASAAVFDLASGQQVLRSTEGMGKRGDDLTDLYEDAWPHFIGFDRTHAYWAAATGKVQIKRAQIGEWQVEKGGSDGEMGEQPFGRPYDAMVGLRSGMLDDGRLSPIGEGTVGFASPDQRWCFTPDFDGHLPAVDCRTAKPVTPTYPGRMVTFGGWHDTDSFFVLARSRLPGDAEPAVPPKDDAPGVIARCTLPAGNCQQVARVARTADVVFATGSKDD